MRAQVTWALSRIFVDADFATIHDQDLNNSDGICGFIENSCHIRLVHIFIQNFMKMETETVDLAMRHLSLSIVHVVRMSHHKPKPLTALHANT
jgi:hypothetical protein